MKRVAYHVVSRLPAHIEVDDLIQAGTIGLLNAAQNFTPTKEDQFREAVARVGQVLEVSESRVCQIHGQAVIRIRARPENWLDEE